MTSTPKPSFGIICVAFEPVPKVLLVQKRCTYAYVDFVHGRHHDLDEQFSQMTIDEKTLVISENFDYMWYRIWLDTPSEKTRQQHTAQTICGVEMPSLQLPSIVHSGTTHNYNKYWYITYTTAKNKYREFLATNRATMRKRVFSLPCGELLWDLPSGKKRSHQESDYVCAVREFYEETGVESGSVDTVGLEMRRTIEDVGVKYHMTYFVTIARESCSPHLIFSNQGCEIVNVRWCTMSDLHIMNVGSDLHDFVRKAYKKIRNSKQFSPRNIHHAEPKRDQSLCGESREGEYSGGYITKSVPSDSC